MKHYNHNLLKQYFTEPTKNLSNDYNSNDIHTKKIVTLDPEIQLIKRDLEQFKYELKMFSLKLLQQSTRSKYQIETVKSLNTKAIVIEKHFADRSYLSPKSILEIKNRLKNYISTFNIIRGEYLKPLS